MNQSTGRLRRCAALLLAGCVLAASLTACRQQTDADSASSAAQAEPVSKDDLNYDASQGVIDTTKFEGTVLPETEDAGADYVDNTLFLGDSNTVRFMMYGDDKTGKAYTSLDNNIGVVSMGVGAITTLKCEEFKGMSSAVTMPEAVKIMQPLRIIITFGTNNLSGTSTKADKFIESYKKGLKAIHEAYPYAAIIVNSIPPLDAQRENSNLSQTQVDAYNEAICQMCTDEGYKYLNSAEALKDEKTGWAKKDYTLGDGVHLSKNGVDALFSYIRTHAYDNEDTRPKPLKSIPTPKGVEPGLISSDPIAVRGAKVAIEATATEGGSVSASASSAKASQSVTLTASANDGYEFTGWELVSGVATLSGTGSSTITLTVGSGNDANGIVVRANFRAAEETWGDWETDDEPTCESSGKAHRTSSWGSTEEKTLDAKGHNWQGDWGSWSGSGATQTRTRTLTCSRCGKTKTEQESRDNPDYTAPTPTPAPQPSETPAESKPSTEPEQPSQPEPSTEPADSSAASSSAPDPEPSQPDESAAAEDAANAANASAEATPAGTDSAE